MYQLITEQKLSVSKEELWDFISNPKNLEKITPDYMNFKVLNAIPEKMYEGLMIAYKVHPIMNLPMSWVTEITKVDEGNYFVDEQRLGPYKIWHHEHHLKEVDGGVLMKDIISYVPPMGVLGKIANSIFIKRQLQGIFKYRELVLNERYK